MRKFLICTNETRAEMTKDYSQIFDMAAGNAVYEFIDINQELSSILSVVSSRDHIHFEVGRDQQKEMYLLQIMLNARYQRITLTLHYPKIFNYEFRQSNQKLLNPLAQWYHKLSGKHRRTKKYLEKIQGVYVIRQSDKKIIQSLFNLNQTFLVGNVFDFTQFFNN